MTMHAWLAIVTRGDAPLIVVHAAYRHGHPARDRGGASSRHGSRARMRIGMSNEKL